MVAEPEEGAHPPRSRVTIGLPLAVNLSQGFTSTHERAGIGTRCHHLTPFLTIFFI